MSITMRWHFLVILFLLLFTVDYEVTLQPFYFLLLPLVQLSLCNTGKVLLGDNESRTVENRTPLCLDHNRLKSSIQPLDLKRYFR